MPKIHSKKKLIKTSKKRYRRRIKTIRRINVSNDKRKIRNYNQIGGDDRIYTILSSDPNKRKPHLINTLKTYDPTANSTCSEENKFENGRIVISGLITNNIEHVKTLLETKGFNVKKYGNDGLELTYSNEELKFDTWDYLQYSTTNYKVIPYREYSFTLTTSVPEDCLRYYLTRNEMYSTLKLNKLTTLDKEPDICKPSN